MLRSHWLLALFLAISVSLVHAGTDYCMEGSDAICQKYGADYCCAKINVKKDGYEDSYHACSPRVGIEKTEGKFSGGGYEGTW